MPLVSDGPAPKAGRIRPASLFSFYEQAITLRSKNDEFKVRLEAFHLQ